MHAIDHGLIKYQVEAFHDIIGEKEAGEAEKARYNQYFRAISLYMSRQSEHNFLRRSGRSLYTNNSMVTAEEHRGNQVVFIISLYTEDVKLLLNRVFAKYNAKKGGTVGPTVEGCSQAVEWMLCYEKWIMEDKPVGEVLESAKRAGEVLTMTTRRFPRRESTLQWDLQKSHGTFKMGTTQQIRHGNGQGWNSKHGERMHKCFFTQMGRQHRGSRAILQSRWRIAFLRTLP